MPSPEAGSALPTLHQAVLQARAQLVAAGISSTEAELDARLLAQYVLGWDDIRFLTDAGRPQPPEFPTRYASLIGRRSGREPMAYITGHKEFWNLQFEVSPAVLIPRPETEIIVEAALDRFDNPAGPIAIADICTGSGCLAVALACERPRSTVVATDISREAIDLARRNMVNHGVADRIHLVETDLMVGLRESFDLIVSNPPYIAERDRPTLPPEVRDHEPSLALFGGDDGLSVMRRLVPQAVSHLKRGGSLIVEFGFGQEVRMRDLILKTGGMKLIELKRDLQGIPRTAIVERQ